MGPQNGLGMRNVHRQAFAAANDYLQRKDIYRGWTSTVNDAETLFAHSNKGFITDNLALEWLHRYGAWTSIRAAGAPRFLLLDGHHTHYSESFQFMRYVVASSCLIQATRCI